MKKSKFKAVIFDFFGTLVPIYSVNSHNELLSAMADKLGISSDFFIDRWLNTFRERVTGKLPDVYSIFLCTHQLMSVFQLQHHELDLQIYFFHRQFA